MSHKVNLLSCVVARRPLSHKVNLPSCVAWRPFGVTQSKSTELCSSLAAAVPRSKSSKLCSLLAPFHHDLGYFRHRTNKHFSSMLFIWKNYKPAYISATQVTEINILDQITEKVILMRAHTFHRRL